MNTVKTLIWIELALIVLMIIGLIFTESYLPAELQNYLALESEATPTTIELIILVAFAIVSILNLISLFGLLREKLWARKLFIYSTFAIFSLCFFVGPQVDHAISFALDQISVLVQGMLLSTLLFNDAYQESAFNKASNPTP